ncbi:MAG: histidine--tRNA ligase [Actinobacteria bacterium]|nr:histidine--tRNA ligase [Actinomycetota bacterium]
MADREDAFRAPKGTNDILPPASWWWERARRRAEDIFATSGYAPVETPMFENTEVFERGVGQATEVVTKQMYTFSDLGGRSLTLRPEGTAPVVRAMLEKNLHRGALPIKLYYAGWMFRQERPQKGRYRQFFQVGIEAIGSDAARADAEVVWLGAHFIRSMGVEPTVHLNSIGHPDESCRGGYIKILVAFLDEHRDELAADDRERISTNPLRTFDSKEASTIAVMEGAPLIADHLCDACRKHFEAVQQDLRNVGIAFTLAPRLVRGLDYYTRTAFEYTAGGLGSQDAIGGGGRYDGLAEALGGPHVPGIGFALGIDRLRLAAGEPEVDQHPVDVYIVALGEDAGRRSFELATRLRTAGVGADLDLMGRGLKGQMKDADRSGARWAVILGEDEMASGNATIRDLTTGEQRTAAFDEVEAELTR